MSSLCVRSPDLCEHCFGVFRTKNSHDNPDPLASLATATSINTIGVIRSIRTAGVSQHKTNTARVRSDHLLLQPVPDAPVAGTSGAHYARISSALNTIKSVTRVSGPDPCDGA